MPTSQAARERGDENVVAPLIFTAIFLLAWAVFQIAIVLLGRDLALEAARDGAHAARLPPVDLRSAEQRARSYVNGVTPGWLSNVDARATSDGLTVTVTVTADAASLVPYAHFKVSQVASEPIESIR